ncbi:MAG TPA: hypothetical protein VMU54_06355 [Planctomycetota bacterium]|nr:hypothetical protein [Planctomycetota bacterium]
MLAALLGIGILVMPGRSSRPKESPAPLATPVPAPARRSEPSSLPDQPLPPVQKSGAPRPVPLTASAEGAELAALDLKIAEASAREKFREAFDLLTAARPAHDSLEWTAAIQRRNHDLENSVKALFSSLQDKFAGARQRGEEAEAKNVQDRIARWELPTYGPEALANRPETPVPDAAAVPAAVPAPAPVAAAPERPALFPFSPGPMKWSLLEPKKMSATGGAVLTRLEDGSILAGAENPAQSRYTVVLQTELKGINAFRLEVLPDRSLGGSGPGRFENGNFVLSEFRVQLLSDPQAESGTPVALERATSDYAQEGFPITHAIDGKNETGWALFPQLGRVHEAVFEMKSPLGAAGPLTLLFVLDHASIYERHTIGRFRLSATTTRNASQEFSMRPPPVIDPARVDQAIQRGIEWLRKAPYPSDYWMSANELILWTYVHAGVPETDPDFQKRLKEMLSGPLDRTYRVVLQAMILEELDRAAYQYRIWQCAQFLVDNQCLNGQWLYGTPIELPKGVATPAKPAVPTTAKLDPEGRRLKPKVSRKLMARKTRDGPPEGDNSNSQYAALGFRACFDAGVQIPEETVYKAVKWWIESQYFDERKDPEYAAKGWSYTSPVKEPRATHTMTSGGISSLTIYDYILGKDWKQRTVTRAGIHWIAQFWVVNSNYYFLYGLERAGVLSGIDKFGRNAWYPMGAEWILDHQDGSGGWIASRSDKPDEYVWNTYNTCFAILFLKHATRPLVASEDPKSR